MKRLETLQKQAREVLDEEYRNAPVNGVEVMDIARAMDKLRDAERVLREAFEPVEVRCPKCRMKAHAPDQWCSTKVEVNA